MLAGELVRNPEAYFGHGDAIGEDPMSLVVASGRNALVVMMQSADVINRSDTTAIEGMDLPALRAIHPQRMVRSPPVIVVEVAREDAAQMPFIQYDHMIQAFSPYAPDPSFHMRGASSDGMMVLSVT